MYKLDTNEGVFFVTDNPRKYMFDYIKNKRALGYRLCEIYLFLGTYLCLKILQRTSTMTTLEQRMKDPRFRNMVKVESVIVDITETIACFMEHSKMDIVDLSKKSGVNTMRLNVLMKGGDVSVKDLCNIMLAFGKEIKFNFKETV